ncbi:twin-arginine translocation signal domain-containing protein (plasmid) [Aliirhizobium terrae]|uniref:twin-arginine translocation signal domain-containing protein n=1 Tax=Terrirhizobium terrae TaxID=2926709 RepID=UPI0025772C30|nr:twin-arginine translocation signal domain-containing protein [Rhizobium sp. CC-CFT758]WJH37934.1 twin-arginine translocation signal domain-containing protein [Rhizobium sp. CC-CFT758]
MSTFELNRRNFLIGAQALAVGAALPAMPGLARAQDMVKMTYLTPSATLSASPKRFMPIAPASSRSTVSTSR